ncbi:hypothetical protein [Pontibacter beigongshangensis]|uniref:hypothetical protein n=1 Tax=Pontibacter beigongshangensis TaxID=2574733 RepID=UPI00165069E0|nr:hypothetical protein [Pontibacter beigongshangensis]
MRTTEVLEYHLSTGLLGRRRTLRLTPEYLEYEGSNQKSDLLTRIDKKRIADIRFDMNWIIWYRFYVGCHFKIDIRTTDDNVLKVRFRSYSGQNTNYLKAYQDITDFMHEHFLVDKVEQLLYQIQTGQVVILQDAKLSKHGINLFPEEPLMPWEEVRVKLYPSFYVIYREGQPEVHKQIFYYDWQSELLLSVTESIIEAGEEGPEAT